MRSGGLRSVVTRVPVVATPDASPFYVGPMNRRDRDEAAALLSRLLDNVDRGEVSADGPTAVALVRRLEGGSAGP